jgi:hypothetical protein
MPTFEVTHRVEAESAEEAAEKLYLDLVNQVDGRSVVVRSLGPSDSEFPPLTVTLGRSPVPLPPGPVACPSCTDEDVQLASLVTESCRCTRVDSSGRLLVEFGPPDPWDGGNGSYLICYGCSHRWILPANDIDEEPVR